MDDDDAIELFDSDSVSDSLATTIDDEIEDDQPPQQLLLRPRVRSPRPAPLVLPVVAAPPPPPPPSLLPKENDEVDLRRAIDESLAITGTDVAMMREYHAARKIKAYVSRADRAGKRKPVVFSVDDLVADGNCGYAVYEDVLNARHGSKLHSSQSIRATVKAVFATLQKRMIQRSHNDRPESGLFAALPADFFANAATHAPYEMPSDLTDNEMAIIDLVYRLRTFIYKTRRPGQLHHASNDTVRSVEYSLPRLAPRDELTSTHLSLTSLFLFDVFSSRDNPLETTYTQCIQLHKYPAGADAEDTVRIMTEVFPSTKVFVSQVPIDSWVYQHRHHCAFLWSVILSSPVCMHGDYEENHFVMLRPHWDLHSASSSSSSSSSSLTTIRTTRALPSIQVHVDSRDSYRIHGCCRFHVTGHWKSNNNNETLATMIQQARHAFLAPNKAERRWLVMWIAGSPQSASVLRLFDPPRAVWLNKFSAAADELSEIERKHGIDRRSAFVYDAPNVTDVFIGCAIKPYTHWYNPIPVGHPFFFFSGTREFFTLQKATKCYGVHVNQRQVLRLHSVSDAEQKTIEQILAAFMEHPANDINAFRESFVRIITTATEEATSTLSCESIPIRDAQLAVSFGRLIELVDCKADHTRLRKYAGKWTPRNVHAAFEFCSTAYHAQRAHQTLKQQVPFSTQTPAVLLLGVIPRMRPFVDDPRELAPLVQSLHKPEYERFHVNAKTLFAYRNRIRNTLLRHGMPLLFNQAGLMNDKDPDMRQVAPFKVNQAQFLETWRDPASMTTLYPLLTNLFNLLLLSGNSDEAAHLFAALMHGSVVASVRAVTSAAATVAMMEDVE